MTHFDGFPPGELRTTPVPDAFFSQVLPDIDDPAELKVTLHVFWLCHRRPGRLRAVSQDVLLADPTLRRSLGGGEDWQQAAEAGLRLALERGTLLRFYIGQRVHYAPNTAPNRAALTAAPDRFPPSPLPPREAPPPEVLPSPATLLYEQHIGLVTPVIAAALAEAEQQYPHGWLADAFAEAAARGKRNWHYVQAILRGWAAQGRR